MLWKEKEEHLSSIRSTLGPQPAVLTHCQEVAVDLQHHVLVQVSLDGVQASPLLLAEVHSHILKGHQSL